MKKLKITIALLAVLGISSCSDFLSEIPDDRTQLDTPEKISEILVNAYPPAAYSDFSETMSDNVFDTGRLNGTKPENTKYYNWEVPSEVSTDTPSQYWDGCYTAIAHANSALEAINKAGNPSSMNPQKAEALLARAYAHFMLVTFWSKRYDPATANSDLGIPYVFEPENVLLNNYKRNSVAEVFNYLEKDIEEGLKYVENKSKQPKYHFNKSAANAFASRFYLIKGDWKKVIALTGELGSNPEGQLRDYVVYGNTPSSLRGLQYSNAGENTNLLISSVNSVYRRSLFSNRFAIADENLNEIINVSTNPYNKSWIYKIVPYVAGAQIVKFDEYFKITNAIAQIGEPYNTFVLLSNDEFFLNRIEAHVMNGDINLATEELNYFLSIRTPTYAPADKLTTAKITAKYPVIAGEYTPTYSLSAEQSSFVKAIAETRRREFLHEGLRWLDIKRFDLVVTHITKNGPVNVLAKQDLRRVLQIPVHAYNRGIEKNPR